MVLNRHLTKEGIQMANRVIDKCKFKQREIAMCTNQNDDSKKGIIPVLSRTWRNLNFRNGAGRNIKWIATLESNVAIS